MSLSGQRRFDLRWTRRNLAALFALCVLAGGLLAVRSIHRNMQTGRQIPVNSRRVNTANEKINPNTASVVSMRRLVGIGPKIAQRIVDYRGASDSAFRRPADLAKVRGIGGKTVLRIRPFLSMEEQQLHTAQEPP